MRNRFKELFDRVQPTEPVEFEEATGVFECQDRDCRKLVHEAKYLPKIEVLTWICPDGHISKIEDFK